MHADRIAQTGFRLASPRPVATGGFIFEMVLAVPGVMDYPERGYSTYTPPEVLSDPVWLASLVGVPVTDDDVVMHGAGLDTETIERHRIGTVLTARWDNEQQAVIAEAVIDVRRGLDLIAAGVTGVSPAYDPTLVDEAGVVDGRAYTRRVTARRNGNNVAVTESPRGQVTVLQPDSSRSGSMDFFKRLQALMADADPAAATAGKDPMGWAFGQLMTRDAERCAAMDAMTAEMTAMKEAAAKKEKPKADDADLAEEEDEVDEASEEIAADSAAAWQSALSLARANGVKVEPAATLVQLERSVAAKIGHADAAASPAVVRAFLAGAASARKDEDDDIWGQLHREQLKKIAATRQADATSTEKTW